MLTSLSTLTVSTTGGDILRSAFTFCERKRVVDIPGTLVTVLTSVSFDSSLGHSGHCGCISRTFGGQSRPPTGVFFRTRSRLTVLSSPVMVTPVSFRPTGTPVTPFPGSP